MSATSTIEWTEKTWNPLTGCTRVSAGCDNCYAARQAATRLKNTDAYKGLAVMTPSGRAAFTGTIRLLHDRLEDPLHWRKPARVFVNSMSDLFHPDVPFDFIDRVFAVMMGARQHTFQVLTKRPERMAQYVNERLFGIEPLPNVWLGTSCEDQAAADERIPHLLRTPAAVRFLSCEPLLGPIQFPLRSNGSVFWHGINWVIAGGESGPGSRPCNIEWIESIIAHCQAAGVPTFVKQLGANPVYHTCRNPACTHPDCGYELLRLSDPKGGNMAEWPERMRVREYPNELQVVK